MPRSETLYHYCIVRGDIPHGDQAAQLIHAAGESSPGRLPPGTFAVALKAKDEPNLRGVSALLTRNGFGHVRIIEDDEPFNGQLMAIGIPPQTREKLRKLLSSLPLVR
ncbi:MAG: hypothetical protein ACYDHY_07765 [Acidiferrobacterales bacterium]